MIFRANGSLKLGISACLLGNRVRYDGGHKHDRFLTDTLVQYVEYVPVCPEVECGLGVPREPLHLVGDSGFPRLVTVETGLDCTERMVQWAQGRLSGLEKEGLCGFVFKSKSPSCGLQGIPVDDGSGSMQPEKTGAGIFARLFMERFPFIPVEDEGHLCDPAVREDFLKRISLLTV